MFFEKEGCFNIRKYAKYIRYKCLLFGTKHLCSYTVIEKFKKKSKSYTGYWRVSIFTFVSRTW